MALCETLPKRIRWSFLAWNRQFPSLGVGRWRYVNPAFPNSMSKLFGDSPLSEACLPFAIHWKTSGKLFSLRKDDARFSKSLAISFRGSSLRVRLQWLPLENSNLFAKRQINTPQSVSFLCFGHLGAHLPQLPSWKRALSSSEIHWSSFLINFSLMVSKIVR